MPPETSRLRIVLVEDHVTVRQGLKLLLDAQPDMQVVAEASDGESGIARVKEHTPEIAVVDIAMPGTNGLAVTRILRDLVPGTRIVALTRYSDDAYLQELLRAGAAGYVLKQSASSELLQAIRAVAAGGQYLDSMLTARVTDGYAGADAQKRGRHAGITERETQVLRLIALGHSNKEIAGQLDLSVKTVEVHKANALRKLGLHGRIDIVRFAVLQGWLHDT